MQSNQEQKCNSTKSYHGYQRLMLMMSQMQRSPFHDDDGMKERITWKEADFWLSFHCSASITVIIIIIIIMIYSDK